MSDVVRLEWSSAEVSDGTLEVALEGELKGRVRVQHVMEGTEDRLRHFLESVVLQANATTQPKPDEDEKDDEDEAGQADERDGPDAQMTERFRRFGAEAED